MMPGRDTTARRDAEAPAGPFDVAAFRGALGAFATGVTVVTTLHEGVEYGLTSNSFAAVSLDPPLVLWSIKRESASFRAFSACSHFAVNVLAADQIGMSGRFAKSGPGKFDGIARRAGEGGSPLLAGAAASFECLLAEIFDGGDHVILIGQVSRFAHHDRQPLLFARGRYAVPADHPELSPPHDPALPLLARFVGAPAQDLAHRLRGLPREDIAAAERVLARIVAA